MKRTLGIFSGILLGAAVIWGCGDASPKSLPDTGPLDGAGLNGEADGYGEAFGSDACLADGLCGEENPCEAEGAPEGCCSTEADCDDGNPATVDICEGATCVNTPNPDQCAADADCDDGDPCTDDRCTDTLCVHVGALGEGCCVAGEQALADFDTGKLQGTYVTDNLGSGIFWNVDKTRATSGSYSLYCGDPIPQSYASEVRVKASATTPVLSIPAGGDTSYGFDLFKATRASKAYDLLQVFVLRSGTLLPAWSSRDLDDGTTGGIFRHIVVPLTDYAGQDVQLRLVFDSVDAPLQPFEGVYTDTWKLTTVCE